MTMNRRWSCLGVGLVALALGTPALADEKAWLSAQTWAADAGWEAAFYGPAFSEPPASSDWVVRATLSQPEERGGREA